MSPSLTIHELNGYSLSFNFLSDPSVSFTIFVFDSLNNVSDVN